MHTKVCFTCNKVRCRPWKQTNVSVNHAEAIISDVNLIEAPVHDEILSDELEKLFSPFKLNNVSIE